MIGAGLTLVTGPTGSGKTLWAVGQLAATSERTLYVQAIPDLKLEHVVAPPVSEWTELREVEGAGSMPYFVFPAGSVLIVDEAQRVYRPRPVGSKVPDYVAALETRRHTGLDVVLITQHPGLIDSNVRKLVNRHVHIHVSPLGRYVLEWVGVGDPESSTSRGLAVRQRYRLNSRHFGLYRSAEIHTKPVVARSWWVYALPLLVMVFLALGYRVYEKVATGGSTVALLSGPKAVVGKAGAGSVVTQTVAAGGYVESYQPRVPDLAYSAPRYDQVTQPVEAPYPVGCIRSAERCRCYDQRGGVLAVSETTCWAWVVKPPFVDFVSDRLAVPAQVKESKGAARSG